MLSVEFGRFALRAALFISATLLASAQSDALAQKSQQAKQMMAEGRFADAVGIYQELTKALPANAGLRLNLALALQMSGNHRESIPEFERVLKSDPNSYPALLSLGVAYLETSEPAKAIGPLTKAITLQPANAQARGMLANALLSVNKPAEAAVHFRKLTATTPRDAKAWYGLGRSYEALAQAAFAQLDKTAQGSPEWLALVADSRMERRQFRSAFYFYRRALEAKPDFKEIHNSIAEVYRRSGHADWADVEAGKSGRPDCPASQQASKQPCDFAAGRFLEAAAGPSLYWRARAYSELALQAFKRLGDIPPSIELHALKAEMLSNHGQHLEAAAEWRSALKLAPDDPRLRTQLAMALYEGANYAEALPLLEDLVKRDPHLEFPLGDALLRVEKPEQALPHLQAAVRSDPKLLPARASLGLALMRTGSEAAAIPHLNAARQIDEDGSIHFQLSRAYQRAGDAAAAKEMMAEYSKIQQRAETEQRGLEEKAVITAP